MTIQTNQYSPQNVGKRLFIASWPDPLVLEKLEDFQSALKKAAHFTPVAAKWIPIEKIHLTYHFLGECSPTLEANIRGVLQEIPEKSPISASIRGTGCFPHSKAPTVLWTAVQNHEKKLVHLHTTLKQNLLKLGCSLPDHHFTPHLTLARFPSLRGTGAFLSVLKSYQGKLVTNWNIRTIELVESCLSQEGPTYKRLLSVPLYS